jgi:ParB family chromosome partitioning protein
VRASDRRALFVGTEAYEAAGGAILRDLFEHDDGGWLQDPALLDGLVTEKLKREAENLGGEGWKWIAAAIDFPYGCTNGLRRLSGEIIRLTEEEHATRDALRSEYDRLEEQFAEADELPDEIDQRLGEIETALAAFENRPVRYDSSEIARAGAFVSIDRDGELLIERGFVRPEDEPPVAASSPEGCRGDDMGSDASQPAAQHTVISIGADTESDDGEDDAIRPLSDRLVTELTAYRTLALRDALANNPHVAFTTLLHTLCRDLFSQSLSLGCLQVSVRDVPFPIHAPDLKESPSAKTIPERHAAWRHDMPEDEDALWDWLDDLDDASRMALLAHCVSLGVNALYEKPDRYGVGVSASGIQRRIAQADRLARAVSLDMAEAGWRPRVDNYLGRVPKARILEAVREAKGEQSAQLIDHLKKADMAREAERLLEGTGWLPEPLRTPGIDAAPEMPSEDSDALPDFLVSDDQTAEEEERGRSARTRR